MAQVGKDKPVDRANSRTPRGFGGSEDMHTGQVIVFLHDWHERDVATDDVVKQLRSEFAKLPGVHADDAAAHTDRAWEWQGAEEAPRTMVAAAARRAVRRASRVQARTAARMAAHLRAGDEHRDVPPHARIGPSPHPSPHPTPPQAAHPRVA